MINTAHKAIEHYHYFGPFQSLELSAPYSSQKFIDAIQLCESAGVEAIIVDTLSSEWTGKGGMLDQSTEGVKDRFDLPCFLRQEHEALTQVIETCQVHFLATLQVNREQSPLQEEGIHYLFDTVVALTPDHKARVIKDRTSFFEEHSGHQITEEVAALFARCLREQLPFLDPRLIERIEECKSRKELLELMQEENLEDAASISRCVKQKERLEQMNCQTQNQLSHGTPFNGTSH